MTTSNTSSLLSRSWLSSSLSSFSISFRSRLPSSFFVSSSESNPDESERPLESESEPLELPETALISTSEDGAPSAELIDSSKRVCSSRGERDGAERRTVSRFPLAKRVGDFLEQTYGVELVSINTAPRQKDDEENEEHKCHGEERESSIVQEELDPLIGCDRDQIGNAMMKGPLIHDPRSQDKSGLRI